MRKIFTLLMILISLPVFSTDVTFMVSMKGSGMDLSNGVFIAGGIYNADWDFHAMTKEGDSLYAVTITLNEGDTIGYYFITQDSWDNLAQFREPAIPNACDGSEYLGWSGDRGLIVPISDTTILANWGTCESMSLTTKVTFQVSMKGSGMDLSNGVYFAGGFYSGNWNFSSMSDEGDSLYSVTLPFNPGDTIGYYFITQDSWDNLAQFREPAIPGACDGSEFLGWSGDRGIIVPESDTTVAFIWGSCEQPGQSTGISNHTSGSRDFRIYPNPSAGDVTISVPHETKIKVELYDISGKQVQVNKQINGRSEIKLNTSVLPSGIYIVKMFGENFTKFNKLILK
jgi:hypothetical protein